MSRYTTGIPLKKGSVMKVASAKTAVIEPAHFCRCLLFGLLIVALYLIYSGAAYATPNAVCMGVDWFGGNFGKGIASAGVIMIGVGATMGKVSWGTAVTVAVGISIMANYGLILGSIGVPSC